MKRLCMALAVLCLIMGLIGQPYALDPKNETGRVKRVWADDEYTAFMDGVPEALRPGHIGESAPVDTYTIVRYDFEEMNWQGWTRIDNTRRPCRCFFHVDDFDGLDGWSPLEGIKSMWCGTRPDAVDPYMCSWISAPGYGNNWSQGFVSAPFFTHGGQFTLSFRGLFDIEPVHDWIAIDYDKGST